MVWEFVGGIHVRGNVEASFSVLILDSSVSTKLMEKGNQKRINKIMAKCDMQNSRGCGMPNTARNNTKSQREGNFHSVKIVSSEVLRNL